MNIRIRLTKLQWLALLCLTIMFSSTSVAAKPDLVKYLDKKSWRQAQSKNFILYTDAGKKRTLGVIEGLEDFRILYQYISGQMIEGDNQPLTVVATKKSAIFNQLVDNNEQDIDNKAALISSTSHTFLVIKLSDKDFYTLDKPLARSFLQDSTEQQARGKKNINAAGIYRAADNDAVFNLLTHHFSYQNQVHTLPHWFVEGLAEHLRYTRRFKKDGSNTRFFERLDRYELYRRYWKSLSETLALKPSAFSHADTRLQSLTQSWLLVNFLYGSTDMRQGIKQYQTLIESGVSSPSAFSKAFKIEADKVESVIKKFFSRLSPKRIPVRFNAKLDPTLFSVSKANKGQLNSLVAELIYTVQTTATQARALFSQVARNDAGWSTAQVKLAQTYIQGSPNSAEKILNSIDEPTSPLGFAVLGNYYSKQMLESSLDKTSEQYRKQATKNYNQAINHSQFANSNYQTEIIAYVAEFYLRQNKPDRAKGLFEVALELSPSNLVIRDKLSKLIK